MTIYSISWCEDIITGDDISDAITALREENNRTEENTATLKVLIGARKEIKSYIDEDYFTSVMLINENHFEAYTRDLVYEDHDNLDSWPFKHIDWELAAEEMAEDYNTLEVEGNTFYYIG